jgi:flagellar hook-associated protein 1 FlgK
MSIPTMQGLSTALSGLLAEQEELDVTGQNIANATTPGYSRETATLQTRGPIDIPSLSTVTGEGAQLGTGVSVESITRIRNAYLDAQYRAQNSSLSSASTQAETLQQAQGTFNEPSSTGLASQLSNFWSAWSSLADSPSSEAAKQAVVAAGQQLAGTIKSISSDLSTVSSQAGEQIASIAGAGGTIEGYAHQIAELNTQIKLSEQAGQPPNEMLDRRDDLLDKLSSLGQVTVTTQANGTDTVSFGDAAKPLVEGATVNWPQTVSAATGGQLGALLGLTAETGPLASYQTSLNSLASTLAGSVNALQPGSPFFSGTTATTLTVTATAATVQTASGEAPGGNALALAIAGLRGGAAETGYAALVEKVGSDVSTAQSEQANFQQTLTAVGNQRQSVSGVSLDEEMTNLISFQRGYQASARTMTAMDSMLETLIEHTGVVGL